MLRREGREEVVHLGVQTFAREVQPGGKEEERTLELPRTTRLKSLQANATGSANEMCGIIKRFSPGEAVRVEGLSDVDEAEQGGLAEQLRVLARLHARLALQRGHEAQRAERRPRWEVAGVGGPGEDAGVRLGDKGTRGTPGPGPGGIDWRKGSFRRAKVLRGAKEKMSHNGDI